jgi:hypothetical protein
MKRENYLFQTPSAAWAADMKNISSFNDSDAFSKAI